MTDLFTPTMPAEIRTKLEDARGELLRIAQDIDARLGTFFEKAWQACFTEHTDDKRWDYVKCSGCGEKTAKKKLPPETFFGTPDFNEFDRMTKGYEQKIQKIRWMLWDEIDTPARKLRGEDVGSDDSRTHTACEDSE